MEENKIQILEEVFKVFQRSFYQSTQGKSFLDTIGIKPEVLKRSGILTGYNNSQFHYRKGEVFLENCVELELLTPIRKDGHRIWGREAVIFPLRNRAGRIVNYYALKVGEEERVDLYLNKEGVFPAYPKADAKYLILTTSIIDACLTIQIPEITKNFTVIATDDYANGEELFEVIKDLNDLEEIIFFPTRKKEALEECYKLIQETLPHIVISSINPPAKEESIQELLAGNESEIITLLLEKRNYLSVQQIQSVKRDKTNSVQVT